MRAFVISSFEESNFFEALSSPHCTSEYVAKRNKVAQYLWRYLRELGATYFIVEHGYIDADYLDDHSAFYSKCFAPYSNRTERLHFFSGEMPTELGFRSAIVASESAGAASLQTNYLGFVVSRPLPQAVIGRTVLKHYPNDNGRRHYPATKLYAANLFGLEMSIETLAFQQQDRALAACATVALWSCFHKTAELYATTSPTPGEITRTASIVVTGRTIPSQGLEFHQMCEAVRAVGLEPEVYRPAIGLPLASLIYAYLHMGQPVILGIDIDGVGHHAITVSGFSMSDSRTLTLEGGFGSHQRVPLRGEWINELYVHDDQTGPFARLVLSNPVAPNESLNLTSAGWTSEDGNARRITVFAVLIPIVSSIRIGFNTIAAFVTQLSGILDVAAFPDLSWDVFLVPSNTYKQLARTQADTQVPSLEEVLFSSHPRYIWCSRLLSGSGTMLEILHDATNVHGALAAYAIRWESTALRNSISQQLQTYSDILREHFGYKLYDWLLTNSR